MSEEVKKLALSFEGSILSVKGDLNQDGQPSIELKIDLSEVLDEIVAAVKTK